MTPVEAVQGGADSTNGRMLALVTDAFGGYGGIAQYNRDFLSSAIASRTLSSITVVPRIAPLAIGALPLGLDQLTATKSRLLYSIKAMLAALRVRPTVVFNGHVLHGRLSLLIARLTGATLISQVHGTEVWGALPDRCREALEKSDLILAVSRDTRSRLLDQMNIEPAKIAVLGNTVGEHFRPGDRWAARSRFALDQEIAILTVARLDERAGYKGHDRIISLLPKLRKCGANVVYLVAGVGPDHDRLSLLAQRLGVGEHVRFLGMVPETNLPDLYLAADLFALPSTGEGFGIVFLEAMACGTPAIGLAVGGIPDALGDGELGRCPAEDKFEETFEAMVTGGIARDAALPEEIQDRFGRLEFVKSVDMHLRSLQRRISKSRDDVSA